MDATIRHRRIELVGAWSGPALLALFFVFFLLVAQLVPPLDPSDTAEKIASIYRDHNNRMTVGVMLMVLVGPLISMFIAALARQVHRIEGYWGVLSLTQIIAGVVVPIGSVFPPVIAPVCAPDPPG